RSCEGVRPLKRSGANWALTKRSCPDWKHQPVVRMPSPDLSEVRVQRRAPVQCVSANPNEVRVRGAKLPELFSFFWYSLERKLVSGTPLTPNATDRLYCGCLPRSAKCPALYGLVKAGIAHT